MCHSGIPERVLATLTREIFESERPELDVSDEQIDDSIRAARTPPEGAGRVAALITRRLPDRTRGYRPFDYLVAAADGQNHPARPIPDPAWERALEHADPDAAFAVGGTAYLRDNIPTAIRASQQAAEAGHTDAMHNLGVLLAGRVTPPDLAGARRWYERAAQAGDTDAMHNLGVLLAGRVTPPDLAGARRWYERAAEAGDTDAMHNLGVRSAPRDCTYSD